MKRGEQHTDEQRTEPSRSPDDTQEYRTPGTAQSNPATEAAPPAAYAVAQIVERVNEFLVWGAFVTPLIIVGTLFLLVNARYDAAVDSASSSAPNLSPNPPTPTLDTPAAAGWPPNVDFVPHTVPALIPNALSFAGAQHGYRFRGTTGDQWNISAAPRSGSGLDPRLDLYSPDGTLLASADNRSTGDLTAALTVSLPQDGMYRLVVESAQANATTGTYLLSVSAP